jgi:hypothetical protein
VYNTHSYTSVHSLVLTSYLKFPLSADNEVRLSLMQRAKHSICTYISMTGNVNKPTHHSVAIRTKPH